VRPSRKGFDFVRRLTQVGPFFLLIALIVVSGCSRNAPATGDTAGSPAPGVSTAPAPVAESPAGAATPDNLAPAQSRVSSGTPPPPPATTAAPAAGPQTYKRAEQAQPDSVTKKLAELKTAEVPEPVSAPESAPPAPARC
jgi:hypothetical protein